MTKLVTAVAALILVEECILRLDDPVDEWLPELANRQVLKQLNSPLYETGALELFDEVGGHWSKPPAFPAGGGGLVSTVDDFLAFGELLRNGGRLGNERILSRPAVEVMTTNQLTDEQQQDANSFFGEPLGWGFGLSVVTGRNDLSMVPGRFGWVSGYGTALASDPKEELTAILMTQLCFPQAVAVYQDFWTGVYQAIDD